MQSAIIDQITQRTVAEVPDPVIGIDEMVTGVEIAIVLQHGHVSAGLAEDAQGMRQAQGGPQRLVEELHHHAAKIPADPLVEHRTQKIAHGLGPSGARAHTTRRAFLWLHQRQEL